MPSPTSVHIHSTARVSPAIPLAIVLVALGFVLLFVLALEFRPASSGPKTSDNGARTEIFEAQDPARTLDIINRQA